MALTLMNIECDSPEDDTEECNGGPDSPTEEKELQRLAEIEVDSNPNSARQKKTNSEKRKDRQHYALTSLERQPLDESAEQLQLKQKEDATLADLWRETVASGGEFMVEKGLLWHKDVDRLGEPMTQLVLPEQYRTLVLRKH